MTDPPIQVWTRYIAIDIHKHYLMIGGIDAHKRIVLQPRRVELHRWLDWAKANLHPTDAVVIEATCTVSPRGSPDLLLITVPSGATPVTEASRTWPAHTSGA